MLAQSGDTESLSSQTVSKMVCAPSLSVTRWNKNAAVQRTVQWNHFINKERLVSLWACEFSLSHIQSGWSGWPGYRYHVRRHVTGLFPPPHIILSPSLSLFLFVLLSVYCFTCILFHAQFDILTYWQVYISPLLLCFGFNFKTRWRKK